ncbi:hypothetical protein imdm_744 [gamma proteobacterium IMCC2047]|nr:hypothetical protein imdm_744 [gamma proteobacterium IMCC2047]
MFDAFKGERLVARKCKRCQRARVFTVVVMLVALFAVLFIDRFMS